MPPGLSLQSDFTAGELSPSLLARVDLAKYTKGCRTLKNFLVQSHGPAVKRPGFELLGQLPGPAVLLEFVFNNDQTYALIFGEQWMYVATHDGFVLGEDGNPYQIATPYTLDQARRLSYVQSADVLFIACQDVAPQRLMRLAHADWQFEAMSFDAPLGAPGSVAAVAGGDSPMVTPLAYFVTAVDADGKEGEAGASASVNGPASNNWNVNSSVAISWGAVEGAEEYRLYKSEYGGRPGYIATVAGLSFTDRNVAASLSEGLPKYVNPFVLDDGEGGTIADYPGAVCLFEQRLVFASTPRRQQTIWMSKSGDYGNFAVYTPIADDSPIELTIASQEVSSANWMVPLRSLIFGTPGMEWEIAGRGDAAFSAKNAKAVPQSYWGSSLKRAIIVGNVILHVSSSGSQVRNLQYDFGSDSYGGADLSILAAHLLEEYKLIDWTYQKNPDSIVWGVRSDGALLGLTFQAEHQIAAWHRHDTQGTFTAVCAVPHGYEYSLFAVVKRDGVYYLERMAERYKGAWPWKNGREGVSAFRPPEAAAVAASSDKGAFAGLASANMSAPAGAEADVRPSVIYNSRQDGGFALSCAEGDGCEPETTLSGEATSPRASVAQDVRPSVIYLDCALTYEGDAAQTISGLDHLEGKEVGIFSQGAVEAPRVVQDGAITLDIPSTLVTVGLPYTADLETMPVEIVTHGGASVGMKKQISTVNIAFHESIGVKAGLSTVPGRLDGVKWQDVKWRTNEPYGTPPAPFSGVKHLTMPNMAENRLSICIRSELPTPVTVQSIASRIEVKS